MFEVEAAAHARRNCCFGNLTAVAVCQTPRPQPQCDNLLSSTDMYRDSLGHRSAR
jgi:hypothetical protein